MRAWAFVLAVCWFGAATYAGYRLTERSFAWVDDGPSSDAAQGAPSFTLPLQQLDALKNQLPPRLMEQAKHLSPQQLLCLQAAVPAARIQAVLHGDVTEKEAAAIQACMN